MPKTISVSEARALMRCLKKHNYQYTQGLEYKFTPDYFKTGTYLHEVMRRSLGRMLVTHSKPKPDELDNIITAVKKEGIDGWNPREHDVDLIDKGIREFWNRDPPFHRVLYVEKEFIVKLPHTNVRLHGIIDALVQDEDTGKLWVIEHKTASKGWNAGQFDMDVQTAVYAWAVEQLTGEKVEGAIFNFFYTKLRKTKPLLAESLFILLSEARQKSWVNDLVQLITLRNSRLTPRSSYRGCTDCVYRMLCHAEIEGNTELKDEFLIERFTRRERQN